MKSDRAHRVPLSDATIEILLALKGDGTPDKREFIFADPSGRPLAEKARRHAGHQINSTISVHGMRSAFRDRAGDTTKYADAFDANEIGMDSLGGLTARSSMRARSATPHPDVCTECYVVGACVLR